MLLGSDINGVGSYEVNLFNLCPHDQKVYIKIVRILLGLPGTYKSCLLYSNAIYVFDFMFALCVYSLRNNLIRAINGPNPPFCTFLEGVRSHPRNVGNIVENITPT